MISDGVRERCEQTVSGLAISSPFDVRELVGNVASSRGRPINLHRWPQAVGAPCGVWLATDLADHIFYDGWTTPVHQQHIILHELGHLLLEHDLPPPLDAWVRVMPSLDPSMVMTALGRSSYADDDEVAAELFASLVIERASRLVRSPAGCVSRHDDAVVERLTHALAATAVRR